MTSRQYKKLNIKARITWICDRYGTVERGYLADYFTINQARKIPPFKVE